MSTLQKKKKKKTMEGLSPPVQMGSGDQVREGFCPSLFIVSQIVMRPMILSK